MSFNNKSSDINQTFIIEPLSITGGSNTLSACTAMYTNNVVSCNTDTEILLLSGETVFNTTIKPLNDNSTNLGSPITRFREINSVSGTSTVWTSIQQIKTPKIDLGLDTNNISRIITADTSILKDDVLYGGNY